MFTKDNVVVRIASVTHSQMEQDEHEVPLTIVTCEIAPFTPELAGDLHDFVRRTLYTAQDVEVNDLLGTATFNIAIPPQAIAVRTAPDTKKAQFVIAEAKVDGIKAKRSKKSSAWTLEFKLTCSPASDHQLAQIVEGYLKARYLTFESAVASLFDEAPRKVTESEGEDEDEPTLPDADVATTH